MLGQNPAKYARLSEGDAHVIRSDHPLVPPTIPIYGYVYNVRTGGLEEVIEATEAGRATGTPAAAAA